MCPNVAARMRRSERTHPPHNRSYGTVYLANGKIPLHSHHVLRVAPGPERPTVTPHTMGGVSAKIAVRLTCMTTARMGIIRPGVLTKAGVGMGPQTEVGGAPGPP